MFELSEALADVAVPQEYGITKDEKLNIASRIARPLLQKLLHDLRIGEPLASGPCAFHTVFGV
jgi:inositol hexakisphosphate/diphosphoinositol-pentakisphosphate kinase